MGFWNKIFGTYSEKEIKKLNGTVEKVLSYEAEYEKLTDEQLQAKTEEFKKRLETETLDSILPEAFAVCREASWRVLGMKHYPVQIMGGIVLHQGRIAEMSTGEGKTLVATLPSYLNGLTGKGVLVVTVNDYLARRDCTQMGKIHNFLGLTTGLVVHDIPPQFRKTMYDRDIVYGTNNEFGFDYLRDNMIRHSAERVQRSLNYVIVDEVDSVLVDEARTPLIISGQGDKSSDGYKIADTFVRSLKKKVIVEEESGSALDKATAQLRGEALEEQYSEYDYVVEEKNKSVALTSKGIAKAEKFYNVENFADGTNVDINYYVQRALKAHGIFKNNIDYMVIKGDVVIVDESTGRVMEGRRYSDGIHQAIEAKENVVIQKESKTLASITYQNFFRKFEKLSGMTGTAMTEEEEFKEIYHLDIISIPTNKPKIRVDKHDCVYITKAAKMRAIVRRVKDCNEKGQPILVGSVSVARSEELSSLFKKEGIKHNVLNAKYHEQEASIIAQAGKFGAVTIATNMAGRGTDIILGGNPEYLALEQLKKLGYEDELISEATSHAHTENEDILNIRAEFNRIEKEIKEELKPEVEKVKQAGGLYVLGSERHESRRIDNQLRGRSGRQGDEGCSEFMLSLEDDLMRIFGKDMVSKMCENMKIPEDTPIEVGILSNSIEKAQKRLESHYYGIRKNVLKYDDILSKQREIVYDERNRLVDNDVDCAELLRKFVKSHIKSVCEMSVPSKDITKEDLGTLTENLGDISSYVKMEYSGSKLFDMAREEITEDLTNQVLEKVAILYKTLPKENVEGTAKKLVLFLLDRGWQEQMVALDHLKNRANLRAYAQEDPFDTYKMESFEMFEDMLYAMKEEVTKTLLGWYKVEMIKLEAIKKAKEEGLVPANAIPVAFKFGPAV